jgi:Tfp pilus tip-associated adhesin PilY1
MGGQVWRFDIGDPDKSLWGGRLLATLAVSSPTDRRIFFPPAAVKQLRRGVRYDAVIVGTGNREVELLAMEAVMAHERGLGHDPRDVSAGNLGYDVESRDPKSRRLRFIEVKGRVWTADTVTVTANEIRTALNQPDQWFLALVYVNDGKAHPPQFVRQPFTQEPEFAEASRTLRIRDLLEKGGS